MADGSAAPDHAAAFLARMGRRWAIATQTEICTRFGSRPCSTEDYGCDDIHTCTRHQGRQQHVDRVFDRYVRMRARKG
jgi:hypothetical protein